MGFYNPRVLNASVIDGPTGKKHKLVPSQGLHQMGGLGQGSHRKKGAPQALHSHVEEPSTTRIINSACRSLPWYKPVVVKLSSPEVPRQRGDRQRTGRRGCWTFSYSNRAARKFEASYRLFLGRWHLWSQTCKPSSELGRAPSQKAGPGFNLALWPLAQHSP